MANQRLFISGPVHQERVGNSMSTTYCYNKTGQLSIFWKGRKVAEKSGVKPGDAFIVSCNGNKPKLNRLKAPHRNSDLLMWLLSFNKENRAYDAESYRSLLKSEGEANGWWGYRQWTTEGEGYAFTLCNRSDCGGVCHIASYVDENRIISKEMVREIVLNWDRGLYWPRAFVGRILRDRFGFTEEELTEIDSERPRWCWYE